MKRGEGLRGGSVVFRRSAEDDVDREIEAHLVMRAEELEAAGWDPAEARAEARRLFGDPEKVARTARAIVTSHQRAVGRTRMMDKIWKDLRYAARSLIRSPGFAFVAFVTLALGIGANTAVFSVVDGVLLRPLPYQHPDQLVWIQEENNRGRPMAVAWPNYRDWHEQATSFSGLAALMTFDATVLGGSEPIRTAGAVVGVDYWNIFPVQPIEGRLTIPSDHVRGAQPVAVVSRSFWRDELASRPLDGLTVEVLGTKLRVVGVIPDGAAYPSDTQVWTAAEPFNSSDSRTAHNWNVVARLASGISIDRARADVDAITKRVVARSADDDPDFLATGAFVVPLVDRVVGDLRGPLYLLLGAAGLVLLVACTNLASTLLARGTARGREMAVRASLGAGRGRLVSQLLTEGLLLSLVGAVGGVGIAWLVVLAIRRAAPSFLPRLDQVVISPGVLLFTAGAALATTLVFAALPALRMTRGGAAEALRSGSRGNAADGRSRVWRLLVGTEVALALVLLVGSALLVRSFQALLAQDPGFDATGVEVVPVDLSGVKYPEPADHARFYEDMIARVQALPGVAVTGVLSTVPIQSSPANGRLELDDDMSKKAIAGYVVASAGAFRALDIPLLAGRLFDDHDGSNGEMVAIVNRAFAERYWPGEDALGKQVNGGGMDDFYPVRDHTFARVVGVVGDVRYAGVGEAARPVVYFPYRQRPSRLRNGASLVMKAASGDAAPLLPSLRETVRAADPDVPIRMRSLSDVVRRSLGERRFLTMVMGGFSLLALILATVGIFGVVSYTVARRTREIGIRVALGADPGSVLGMVVGRSMGMVLGGLLVGAGAALLSARIMRSFLYQVGSADPVALGGGVVLLGAAALLASWIPARRGTRVDPMVTMRSE